MIEYAKFIKDGKSHSGVAEVKIEDKYLIIREISKKDKTTQELEDKLEIAVQALARIKGYAQDNWCDEAHRKYVHNSAASALYKINYYEPS